LARRASAAFPRRHTRAPSVALRQQSPNQRNIDPLFVGRILILFVKKQLDRTISFPQEKDMKKAVTLVPIVLALAAASPAMARANHHRFDPAPYSHVDSGWGPPTNWNDIEISHPEGGG
jgi:hypothetical protein